MPDPGVQAHVVVVAARGDKTRLQVSGRAHVVEPDHASVEVHGLGDVTHGEVDVANLRFGGIGLVQSVSGLEVERTALPRPAAPFRC